MPEADNRAHQTAPRIHATQMRPAGCSVEWLPAHATRDILEMDQRAHMIVPRHHVMQILHAASQQELPIALVIQAIQAPDSRAPQIADMLVALMESAS